MQVAIFTISAVVKDKEQLVYEANRTISVQEADVEAIRSAMRAERLLGETQRQPQAMPKRVLEELRKCNFKRQRR